jgi:hypothetical protein
VKGGAFEQGAAQNIAGLDEGGGKFIPFPGGVPRVILTDDTI